MHSETYTPLHNICPSTVHNEVLHPGNQSSHIILYHILLSLRRPKRLKSR